MHAAMDCLYRELTFVHTLASDTSVEAQCPSSVMGQKMPCECLFRLSTKFLRPGRVDALRLADQNAMPTQVGAADSADENLLRLVVSFPGFWRCCTRGTRSSPGLFVTNNLSKRNRLSTSACATLPPRNNL
ncbi:unnamed protein product [Ostreobium quekettii]|uniref:Uncharacterized protein n=1 Tax=Ostreobium quekettii TaxID=121088 RepID=A0A8S1IX02_9CHLO|nr:unnamed protein product [Ostreobium quekettii]